MYRIPAWKGDLFSRGNILFAGDAAGQVLPLTYEGIYYAMKSGELAAQAIIEEKLIPTGEYGRHGFRKDLFLWINSETII